MVFDPTDYSVQKFDMTYDLGALDGMLLYLGPFVVGELFDLVQNLFTDPYLADVVQEAGGVMCIMLSGGSFNSRASLSDMSATRLRWPRV